jgi:hypothetical protein
MKELTKYGARQFKNNHQLTLLKSAGYISIGAESFKGFSVLKRVRIPEGVRVIKAAAFKNATALRQIILPESLYYIEEGAFENCTSLDEIVLPPGVTMIPPRCFRGDKRLKNVEIMGNVTEIGKDAFCNCIELSAMPKLDNVKYIGERAFYRCKGIEGVLNLPQSLRSIGDEAFLGTAIERLELGTGVRELGFKCFFRCRHLVQIEIPANVERIDDWAFHGCSSLKSMTMLYEPEIGDWLTNRCTTWYCPKNSKVIEYCQRHEYPCVTLELAGEEESDVI